MRIDEIEARMAEIRELLNAEDTSALDIPALTAEVRSLKDEKAELEARGQAMAALRSDVAPEVIAGITAKTEKKEGRKMYTAASPEYRSGILKTMRGQELTPEERNAVDFVATTTDSTYGSGSVLPTTMVDRVWDLVEEQHSILGDVTMYRTGTIMEIAVRTEITQGDAKSVNENAANDDEINTMTKVTLSGKDFSKHVDISYAMAKMSNEAFEDFLVNEIGERIGAALAADVVAQILSDYDDDNNALQTAAAGAIAWTDVTALFAVLKNAKGKVVYGSESTIYGYLAGMVDQSGRPIFQPNAQNGVEGYLLGAPVKAEDAVTGKVLLVGDPSKVVLNVVQDVMVETDRDIKKHVITYSGYARAESKLVASKAFGTLTVQESP